MTSRREQFRAIFLAAIMVVSMVGMGATALAGSAAAADSEDETVSGLDSGGESFDSALNVEFPQVDNGQADVLAGSEEQLLPRLELVAAEDEPAVDGTIKITLPDELSYDTDATEDDIDFSTSGEISGPQFDHFEDDEQTLVVSVEDGSEETGDSLGITGISVEATPDLDADFEGEGIDADVTTGFISETDEFTIFDGYVNKLDDGDTSVPADGSAEIDAALNVNTPDDDETAFEVSNDNLPLDEDTDVVISANETDGISFDTSATTLEDIEFEGLDDIDGHIDINNIEVTEQDLILPVNETFGFDENFQITEGVHFAAEPDSADESDIEMTYEATNSSGVVDADSEYTVNVQNPDVGVFDEDIDLAAGIDEQEINSPTNLDALGIDASVNTQYAVTPTDDDGQIEEGQNVTLVMNSSDITFADQNKDLEVNHIIDDEVVANVPDIIEVETDEAADESHLTFEVDHEEFGDIDEDATINSDEAFTIGANEGEDGEELTFNVSNTVDEEERVGFTLETGDEGEVVSEPEDNNVLEADYLSIEPDLFEDEDEILVDGAGASGYELGMTVDTPTTDAVGGVTVAGEGTNITVDLDPADFSFDQRQSYDDSGSAQINTDEDEIGIHPNTLEFQVEDAIHNDEEIDLFDRDDGALNFSTGVPDADFSVTTNSTSVETTVTETVESVDLNIDGVGASDERDHLDDIELGEGIDVDEPVIAGEEETAYVVVANESFEGSDIGADDIWPYGGADVDLEVEEHPDGADDFDVSLTNVTSVETAALDAEQDADEWGYAAFNFTGTVAGDYVINATVDDEHVTIDYEVEGAAAEEVSVDTEENAFRGGSSDTDNNLQTGVFNLTLIDEFDNPTTTSPADGDMIELDMSLTPDQNLLEISDRLDKNDGTPEGEDFEEDGDAVINTNDLNDGFFYAFTSSSASGSHNLNLEAVGQDPTPDIDGDSADVRFYAKADNAELDVGDGQINIDDDEREIEAHVEVGDELIEVPRLNADFNIDNESVATLDADSAETNANGVATVNVTPEALGDTTVDVEFTDDRAEDQTAEADISVVETAPNFDVSIDDVDSIVEGNDVSVDVNVDNTGDADGEQEVELVVEDEGISDSTTVSLDAGEDVTETFELETAELEPDDYTLVASSDDDDDEATLTIEEAEVELDVSLDDIEIFEGNTTDVDVDVENTGNTIADEIDVTLDIEDLDELDQTIEDLSDGDTETVTFEDVETDDLEEGDYDMEATATHDDDEASDTATLTVQEVEDEEEEDEGIPGFTAGIAALALLGAALLALRLRNEE